MKYEIVFDINEYYNEKYVEVEHPNILSLRNNKFNIMKRGKQYRIKDNTNEHNLNIDLRVFLNLGITILNSHHNKEVLKSYINSQNMKYIGEFKLFTDVNFNELGIDFFDLEMNTTDQTFKWFLKKNFNSHIPDDQRNIITINDLETKSNRFQWVNKETGHFTIRDCKNTKQLDELYAPLFDNLDFKKKRQCVFDVLTINNMTKSTYDNEEDMPDIVCQLCSTRRNISGKKRSFEETRLTDQSILKRHKPLPPQNTNNVSPSLMTELSRQKTQTVSSFIRSMNGNKNKVFGVFKAPDNSDTDDE